MGGSGFGECWARSYFSFLEGASAPEEMVERAVELEMSAVSLVDRGGLYGAVRLVRAAERAGLGAMVGAELDLAGGGRLAILATDRPSYQQLCRAVSRAQMAGVKGASQLELAGLEESLELAAGGSAEQVRDAARPRGLLERIRHRSPADANSRMVDPEELDRCVVLAGGPHSPISRALLRGDRQVADRAAHALAIWY